MTKGILEIKTDEECINCPLIQTKTIREYNDMTGKYKTVVSHYCTRVMVCEELRNRLLKEVYHIKEEEKDGQE